MLHHVELYVRDLERSIAFWTPFMRLLGFAEERWSQGVNYVAGEQDPYVTLVQAPAEHVAAGYHRRRVGLNHLAFRARSRAHVDEVRAWVAEAGFALLYDDRFPFATAPGYYAVFCEDPDRIKLEVAAPAEPEEQQLNGGSPGDDGGTWHRTFAAEANDRAWTLSEMRDLTTDEEAELLDAAHAAAHHWRRIGSEAQIARANLLLGRVHALLGHGRLAMHFATTAFDSITSRDGAPWEVAFAHAIVANAAAAAGDAAIHAKRYAEARALGEGLAEEERALFLATFDLVPAPGTSADADA